MLSLRILCGACSAFLMYVGLLVYQDEQLRFKNRVETLFGNLWIRLSDLQVSAYRNEQHVLRVFRRTVLALFDSVMGKQIVSVRAFAVSVLISSITGVQLLVVLASFSVLITTHNAATRSTDVRILAFSSAACCVWFGLVYVCRFRWPAISICIAGPLFISFGISYLTAYDAHLKRFSYHATSHLTQTVFAGAVLGTWLSVLSDLSATVFVRLLLELQEVRPRRFRNLFLSFAMPLLVTCLPYLGVGSQVYLHHKGLLASFSASAAVTLTYLNADIFVFVVLISCVGFILTAHHLSWPTVLRLLYLLKDVDLLPSRKALLLLGVTLAVGAAYSPAMLLPILKRELGIPDSPPGSPVDSKKAKQLPATSGQYFGGSSSVASAEDTERKEVANNTATLKPWLTLYIASAQNRFADLKGNPQGPEGQQTWTVPRHPLLATCQIDEVPSAIVCTLALYKTCSTASTGYNIYLKSLSELLVQPWTREARIPFPAEQTSSRFISPDGTAVVAWVHRDAASNACQLFGAVYSPPKRSPPKGKHRR